MTLHTSTTNNFISEKEYPFLRDVLSDLVVEFFIDGIYWYEEDNTGEISIHTNIFADLKNLEEEDLENLQLSEQNKVLFQDFIDTLEKLFSEKVFTISYK